MSPADLSIERVVIPHLPTIRALRLLNASLLTCHRGSVSSSTASAVWACRWQLLALPLLRPCGFLNCAMCCAIALALSVHAYTELHIVYPFVTSGPVLTFAPLLPLFGLALLHRLTPDGLAARPGPISPFVLTVRLTCRHASGIGTPRVLRPLARGAALASC